MTLPPNQDVLTFACDGWDADFAQSGGEALRMCSQEKYDVIVSDMRMPEMDGAELLAKSPNATLR